MFKKISFSVSLGCLLLTTLVCSAAMPAPQSTVQPLDRAIAIVGDDVVTQSQLQKAMKRAKHRMTMAHMTVPPEANFKETVLQQLIDRRLQLQLAKRAGIKVSNQQVNQFVSQLAKQKRVSVKEWRKQQLLQQGYNSKALTQALKDQMMINQVQAMSVAKNIKITAKDIAKVKQAMTSFAQQRVQYHVLDYLVPLADSPTPAELHQAKQQAAKIRSKIKAGQAILPGAGVEKNDMGWQSGKQLPNLFLSVLSNQKTGFVSQPLVAGNGIHVLALLGRQGTLSALPSDAQVRAYAMQQQFVVQLAKWLKTIRKSAYIKMIHS